MGASGGEYSQFKSNAVACAGSGLATSSARTRTQPAHMRPSIGAWHKNGFPSTADFNKSICVCRQPLGTDPGWQAHDLHISSRSIGIFRSVSPSASSRFCPSSDNRAALLPIARPCGVTLLCVIDSRSTRIFYISDSPPAPVDAGQVTSLQHLLSR